MEEKTNNTKSKNLKKKPAKSKAQAYAKYSGMAGQLGISIAVFAYIGQWLDGYFETGQPYWTAALALTGTLGGLYLVIKDLNKM